MFKPIDKLVDNQPNRYYEMIIDSIRTMMMNGELTIGGKLPSERELAEMFNVSRVPVREALKVLEFMGVVQNIRGEGMYIKNLDISNLIDKLDFAIETTGDTIDELFELRETLETTAAKLAAQRRTEKDIQKMQAAIDDMEHKIIRGVEVYESSYLFHNAVIKAAKNKVLYSVYESLNEFLNVSRKATLSHTERLGKSLEYHKRIFERIVNQDSEGAMTTMLEHLVEAKDSIHEE